MNMNTTTPRWRTVVGWSAVALFVLIYGAELIPHHGPPLTIQWMYQWFGRAGVIVLNLVIVLAFLSLFAYRRPSREVWASKGAFVAFVIALMTEMFGWPLLIFLLSPLVKVPTIARSWFQAVGHWPAMVGTVFSLAGVALIALGWQKIHRAGGLVTDGIYRYIRHPQYVGIFLFTFGWLLHWPSVITLILWPFLIAAYTWLALYEEKQLIQEFGPAYQEYARKTARFIPGIL
ncbi:MAG: isoprenylcysteine carboxylmethyltransferase family protein [Calditrichaeota bacterium]|nr:MAG: isoprenylcysteine carboxylmethyltransferase family protein [Calditrichota bacterium]